MKAKIIGLLMVVAGFAQANPGSVYLGGALDLSHCSQMAGDAGYRLAIYGPGFDGMGIYYPFINACFGQGKKDGGDTGSLYDYWYYPYLRTGYDMKSCITDIAEVKGLFTCTPWLGNHSYILECEAKRRLTKNEGIQLKQDIARYKCVDLVDGPRSRRNP